MNPVRCSWQRVLHMSLAVFVVGSVAGCTTSRGSATHEMVNQTVEASCGQCQFGLTDPPGCDLAIRTNGDVYFVDGAHIDDFGDAHDHDGFCQAIRRAHVTGTIDDGRFHAEEIVILQAVDH